MRELRENGSPKPIFETDEERTYLEMTIAIREGFGGNMMSESVSEKMSELMSEKMSELEKRRLMMLLFYLDKMGKMSSNAGAELLDVETKTASRLLGKAEKLGILESEGKIKSIR